METLPDVRRIRVRPDGDVQRLVADGEVVGKIDGAQIELAGLQATVTPSGERTTLVASRNPVLRFDPAGNKATTLTLARHRFRLARQKWLPGLRRWILRDGVAGPTVLTVSHTPAGISLSFGDEVDLSAYDRTLLAAGALAVVLGVGPLEG